MVHWEDPNLGDLVVQEELPVDLTAQGHGLTKLKFGKR